MATVTSNRAIASVQAKAHPYAMNVVRATYTFAGEAAGTVVQMAKLPKGAKPVFVELQQAALGAGVTCQVGDVGDTDRYIKATTANTALIVQRNNEAATPYTLTADGTVDVLTAGGAATGRIDLVIGFVMDD